MIILVGGEKGGTGKTTLAVNLVVMRAMSGKDVLLLDADPQKSASLWAETRAELGHQPAITSLEKTGRTIHHNVAKLREKYDDIIIDTGGRDSPELRAGLLAADLAVVPLRPALFDAWAMSRMSALLDDVLTFNDQLIAKSVINCAHTNPSVTTAELFTDYLADFGNITMMETVIRDRIAFQRAAMTGQAVIETGTDPKAISEIESLYREVWA